MAITGPQQSRDLETVLKTFVAGGIAGCCAKSAVAPFDRVKILLQAHHKQYRQLGVFQTLGKVVSVEGFGGLYKGNGAQMVRIFPYAAIQFATYEIYKTFLQENYGSNHLTKLAAGSMAGLTAVLCTYPLDVIRARLAFQVAGEVYSGITHAFKVIFTEEGGIPALYRGIVPTMMGMAPYAGLSFLGFENLKVFFLTRFPDFFGKPCPRNDGSLVLTVKGKLLCGGLAGAFAQTISYPFDVARRKMQLSMMLPESHKFSSWYATLGVVWREHGIKNGLYRGLSVNYIKVSPMVAVSFSVYELVKQLLGMDTHVER